MKKILFALLSVTMCSMSGFSQKIGFEKYHQFRITGNIDPIKAEWEHLLLENKIPTVLVKFEIRSSADVVTGNTFYMLVGSNKEKTVKVARLLKYISGDLSFKNEEKPGIAICNGCNNGCNPTLSDGQWICGDECPEDKECKSIVTDVVVIKK